MASSRDTLSERQFRRLVDLIQGKVGIRLPPMKRVMVEARLRRRVRALDLPDLASYGEQVIEGTLSGEELVHLIDCVTTNKTDFFREPAHFDALRDTIVPKALANLPRGGQLKVWSSACSTGAEPYTIAMVLDDIASRTPFRFQVLGTDISTQVLAQARRAIYPADMASAIPEGFRRRYVMRARDPAANDMRIVPELRRMVGFGRVNLMDAQFPVDRDMDVIFCRNVLIYFDRATQRQVLDRLITHLKPGGWLLIGHSESMACHDHQGVRQVMPTIYQAASAKAHAA